MTSSLMAHPHFVDCALQFGFDQLVRTIEATAEAEERGIFQSSATPPDGPEHVGREKHNIHDNGGGETPCCEKHAFQLERSAVHMLEERVKETSSKVGGGRALVCVCLLAVFVHSTKRCCCCSCCVVRDRGLPVSVTMRDKPYGDSNPHHKSVNKTQ